MILKKMKRGVGIAETIGAIVIISIISMCVTSVMLNSVHISSLNGQKVLAQSACTFYINAIKTDVEETSFNANYNNNITDTINSNESKSICNSGEESSKQRVNSLFGSNSNTALYYNNETLNLNNKVYNYKNVAITTSRTKKISGGNTIYLFNVEVKITYSPNRTETMTYDFYIEN